MVRIARGLGSSIAKAAGQGVASVLTRRDLTWQARVVVLLILGFIILVILLIDRCIKDKKSKISKCKNTEQFSVAGCKLSELSCMKGASIANPASAINCSYPYQPLASAAAPTPSVIHNNEVLESGTAMAQLCEPPPSYTDAVLLSQWSSNLPSIVHEQTDQSEHPVRPPRRPRPAQATAITTPTIPISLTQPQSPVVADISKQQ